MLCLHLADTIRVNPPSLWQWGNFVVAKVSYVILRVVVPCYYMPFTSVVSLQTTHKSYLQSCIANFLTDHEGVQIRSQSK